MAAGGKDSAGVQAWTLCDLPTVRNQLGVAKTCLQPLLSQLGDAGDSRGYHSLGPLTPAHESVVTSNLALIQEALEQFTQWSKEESADTSHRYLSHCKEVSDRVGRLQDNRRALAESRRLLERHTSTSSRRKFLEQLEAIAREEGVTFFSMEEGGVEIADTTQPTHCLSGQTFVLDLHVDSKGKVSWAKLQRIKSDGDSVPAEGESGEAQWEALNGAIAAGMHSVDMEANLKSKFKALHLIEEAHAKFPDLAVYDALRELEVAVEKLHADKTAMADTQPAWQTGVGSIKRLVEGLQMEYYQSVAPSCGTESSRALLQLAGVTVGPGQDAKPKTMMGLHLEPPVMVSMPTVGSLQTLGQKVLELPVPIFRVTNGVAWHRLVRPNNATPKEGCVVKARGRKFWFVDHSTDAMGVEVHNVPVSTAADVFQALQVLRQQQVMTEVYTSCLVPDFDDDDDDDEEEEEVDSARTNGAHASGMNGHGDEMQTDAVPPRLMELTAVAPTSVLLHTALGQDAALDLLCIEINVQPGGDIAAKLHVPAGSEAPCTEQYATQLLQTCKSIPLALSYMFQS